MALGVLVEAGMLGGDVGADAGVDGDVDVVFVGGGEDADFGMSEFLRGTLPANGLQDAFAELGVADHAAERFASAQLHLVAESETLVEVGEFIGHAELAFGHGVGESLAGLAD